MIIFDSIKKIKRQPIDKAFKTRLRRLITTAVGYYAIELDTEEARYLYDADFGSKIPLLISKNNLLEVSNAAKTDIERILDNESDVLDYSVSVNYSKNKIDISIVYSLIGQQQEQSSLTLSL